MIAGSITPIKQLQTRLPPPPPPSPSPAPPSHQSKKLIHFLTHKENPDFDGLKAKLPEIVQRPFSKLKNQTKKLPLKVKKHFDPQGVSGFLF